MAPVLESLYQQYGQDVVFLTVSGSWNGASANDAASFVKNYGSSWLYVYDSSGTTFSAYGVQATPTFFLIDRNGQITSTYQGEVAAETLAADITRLSS
jgi:cytochrome oxidase Cu insertion factor (SCO1/SenC/PrrC family)